VSARIEPPKNTLLDTARREGIYLRVALESKDAELEELKQSAATLQINYSLLVHQFEGAQTNIANAQERAEILIAAKSVVEDELAKTQEKPDQARKGNLQVYAEIKSLNTRLDSAFGDVEGFAATNRVQRQEIEESKAALSAANLTITEPERQLAEANALATQRREFAENVRKANEGFSIENQRLIAVIERLNPAALTPA
jgi:chromosome segregation ATPase